MHSEERIPQLGCILAIIWLVPLVVYFSWLEKVNLRPYGWPEWLQRADYRLWEEGY